ncbi:MAG: APC family permease, partial [Thermoplasmata archaeon]
GGWLLTVGYIGTLALYAYTFGIYGAAMLGTVAHNQLIQHLLESLILTIFLGVNLYGVKMAGNTEDVIVLIKVLILLLFAGVGLFHVKADHLSPLFNHGGINVLMGATLIFVAYEGFELIPNVVNEMKNPGRDLTRGIWVSIGLTMLIYILVSLVAVGNLTSVEINKFKEYALAVAAKPFFGHAGFILIGLGALLSTASAINATLFGAARLSMVMAQEKDLPKVFSHRERTKDIPWVSLAIITIIAVLFANMADLTIISSFASSTFLLLFAAINLSALRLRGRIGIGTITPLVGLLLSSASWLTLISYLWQTNQQSLISIGLLYLSVIVAELVFSKRRLLLRDGN